MSRRTERIDECCDLLKEIWKINPDLRLGQWISIAFRECDDWPLWNVEDDVFLDRLLQHSKHPPIEKHSEKTLELMKKIEKLKIFEEEEEEEEEVRNENIETEQG